MLSIRSSSLPKCCAASALRRAWNPCHRRAATRHRTIAAAAPITPANALVAADELAESIHRPDHPRRHRLAIEKPAKVQGEGVRALVSPPRFLLETAADDRLEIRRYRAVELAQWDRIIGHDLDQRLDSGGPGEGRSPGNQIVEGGADRVDISSAVDAPGVALDLFRRHVSWRPDHGPEMVIDDPAGVASDPEIEDICVNRAVPADIDHDVARFEIAVDHPVGVRRLSRLRHLLDDLHLALERQPGSPVSSNLPPSMNCMAM